MRTLAACLLALLPIVLGACGSTKSQGREKLGLATRDVFDSLQYGDFQVVAQYLTPENRTDFLARAYGAEKNLKITEFSPVGMDLSEDESSARMVTRISWYELPSTSVKTENVFLDWRKRTGSGGSSRWSGGPCRSPIPPRRPRRRRRRRPRSPRARTARG